MRYIVRTPEGSLTYSSMLEVEKAFQAGLVGPDDEIQEEGGTTWRKASSYPRMAKAQGRGFIVDLKALLQPMVVILMLGLALYYVVKALKTGTMTNLMLAIAFGGGVSVLLTRLTYRAFTGKKPPAA
jgi:hypothetical protein